MHVYMYTQIEILYVNVNINRGLSLPFKNFVNYLVGAVNSGFINIFLPVTHSELA